MCVVIKQQVLQNFMHSSFSVGIIKIVHRPSFLPDVKLTKIADDVSICMLWASTA